MTQEHNQENALNVQDVDKSNSLTDLSPAERDYMYNLGVKHVVVENYAEAIPIFELLTNLDGNNYLYAKALAGALQASKKYFEAYFYYQASYMINNKADNRDCLFYSGVCLYEFDLKDLALNILNKFVEDSGIYENLLAKAKLYIKLINANSN